MQETSTIVTPPVPFKPAYSMKGMAYVPMPLGAIRIGHTIKLPNGQLELVRDDEFKITLPLREADGAWLPDPLNAMLRQGDAPEGDAAPYRKLREIPIKIHVNDPSLVVRSRLEAFDVQSRRTVCASNGGGSAKRWSGVTGTTDVECVGCNRCSFANSGAVECKFFGRIAVQIEGQEGELGTYVMRTSSYNTLRTFEAKLWQFWAILGQKLRGVPFVMKLRAAQSELSNWGTFYYVDLELNKATLAQAIVKAREQAKTDFECGFDILALQEAMNEGIRNGGFLSNATDDGVDLSEFISASSFTATLHAAQACPAAATLTGQPTAAGATNRVDVPTDSPQADPAGSVVNTITFGVPASEARMADVAGAATDGIYVPGFDVATLRKSRAAKTQPATTQTVTNTVPASDDALGSGICMPVRMSSSLSDLMS
ncbi:hypothetical protein Rfer_4314 (plasmid) [Rhodoferax ferrireducens T118]|uniref:Uncharacterized protein n=1 Tax=Albidiferax ferrireducens (strain ATCC BAA-621 / DSM 15236 / T118) TaxID=338969 RepID=Q21QE5_ALBFT|nr:hypothetical protein [Rhodoferax ferrireducens]ABD72000.1 hypothetical protein Rfer_4314 [Rhodoferax ferrireducens T118]